MMDTGEKEKEKLSAECKRSEKLFVISCLFRR